MARYSENAVRSLFDTIDKIKKTLAEEKP